MPTLAHTCGRPRMHAFSTSVLSNIGYTGKKSIYQRYVTTFNWITGNVLLHYHT